MTGRVAEWNRERAKLKKIYEKKGITTCEARFEGCWYNNALSFAHRYKRNDPRCTHTFKGTLLLCTPCHSKIEYNRELTDEIFKTLRI